MERTWLFYGLRQSAAYRVSREVIDFTRCKTFFLTLLLAQLLAGSCLATQLGKVKISASLVQAAQSSSPNREKARNTTDAEREFEAAETLRRSGVAADLRIAVQRYEKARDLWQAGGDQRSLALTHLRIGQVLSALHQDTTAAASLTTARQLARTGNEATIEAEALIANGMLLLRHGNLQTALRDIQAAHGIGVAKQNLSLQATADLSLAKTFYYLGNLATAKDNALKALEISRQTNEPLTMATALYWLGCISMVNRTYDSSLKLLEESFDLAHKVADLPTIVDVLTQLGGLYSMVGQKQKALEIFVGLEPLATLLQDAEKQARVYNGLDSINQELGNIDLSLEYCRKTLEMYQAANYMIGAAQIYGRLAGIQTRRGQYTEALRNYERALKFFQQNGMTRNTYYALSDVGELYAVQGNNDLANKYFRQAQSLMNAADDPREYAYLLVRLGRITERTSHPNEALQTYHEALKLNRSSKDLFGESQTLRLIAGAEKKLNNRNESLQAIEGAIDVDETLRRQVGVSDLRASYFAEVNEHFEFLIDLLMSGDDQAKIKALEISERKRARTLLDQVAQSARTDFGKNSASALIAREEQIKREVEAKRNEYAKLKTERQPALKTNLNAEELLRLTQEYHQVRSVIGSDSAVSDASAKLLSAGEIQAAINDENTTLLEYSLGEQRSFLWAVSHNGVVSFELPKRSVIEEAVLALTRALRPEQRRNVATLRIDGAGDAADVQKLAQRLSEMLLTPAARQISSARRLVIVPDGPLHYVPFSVLPKPSGPVAAAQSITKTLDQPLVADYEITVLPSVSFLLAARNRLSTSPVPAKTIAIIANPVFEKEDGRLLGPRKTSSGQQANNEQNRPSANTTLVSVFRDFDLESSGTLPRLFSTQREAKIIQSLVPQSDSFLATDFDANRSVFTSNRLSEYRIIHIATHGFFDSAHPELSGIVLSLYDQQGRQQNGFVQIQDIYELKLNASVVVLSACQTGLGKNVKGEGITGLPRAFMMAGARRVVASLWKVDDDATTELMMRFYKQMFEQGRSPAAALRAAQLEISAYPKWKDPVYWAGFFITGDFQ
jgi:CHAT domain-containing protein